MQEPPGTPLARRRERVAGAAEALIAERGPAVTMAEVARAAGLGMSSVYNTFASKEELLELLDRRRAARWDEAWRGLHGQQDPRVALAEALWAIAETQHDAGPASAARAEPPRPGADAPAADVAGTDAPATDVDPLAGARAAGLRPDALADDVLRASTILRALPRGIDEHARRRVLAIYVDGLFAGDSAALPRSDD